MTSGTKILLAVVTLFVGILVVYYGFYLKPGDTPLVVESDPAQSQDEVIASTPMRPEGRGPVAAGGPLTKLAQDAAAAEEPDVLTEFDRSAPVSREESKLPPVTPVDTRVLPDPLRSLLPMRQPTLADSSESPASSDGGKGEGVSRPSAPAPASGSPSGAVKPASPSDAGRAKPPAAARPGSGETTRMYTVRDGDSMSSIAAAWFGDETKWDLIAQINDLKDPDVLKVGQVLRLPPKDVRREAIRSAVSTRATTYTVRSGDTLSEIARAFYSNGSLWTVLYDANRQAIGSDPGALEVGMRLTIPPKPAG